MRNLIENQWTFTFLSNITDMNEFQPIERRKAARSSMEATISGMALSVTCFN